MSIKPKMYFYFQFEIFLKCALAEDKEIFNDFLELSCICCCRPASFFILENQLSV